MSRCKDCGSWAINPDMHGRTPGADLKLCDVCYWRTRANALESQIAAQKAIIDEVADIYNGSDGVYGWHLNGNPAPWREFDLPDLLHDFYSEEPQR